MHNQTELLCQLAIDLQPSLLDYVVNQTEEICIRAINQMPTTIGYVREQTPELCLLAVSKCAHVLAYVREQTEEICLLAVNRCGYALRHVSEQTEAICLAAVNNDPQALQFVKNKTSELCTLALLKDPNTLSFCDPQIVLDALMGNSNSEYDTLNKATIMAKAQFEKELSDGGKIEDAVEHFLVTRRQTKDAILEKLNLPRNKPFTLTPLMYTLSAIQVFRIYYKDAMNKYVEVYHGTKGGDLPTDWGDFKIKSINTSFDEELIIEVEPIEKV